MPQRTHLRCRRPVVPQRERQMKHVEGLAGDGPARPAGNRCPAIRLRTPQVRLPRPATDHRWSPSVCGTSTTSHLRVPESDDQSARGRWTVDERRSTHPRCGYVRGPDRITFNANILETGYASSSQFTSYMYQSSCQKGLRPFGWMNCRSLSWVGDSPAVAVVADVDAVVVASHRLARQVAVDDHGRTS